MNFRRSRIPVSTVLASAGVTLALFLLLPLSVYLINLSVVSISKINLLFWGCVVALLTGFCVCLLSWASGVTVLIGRLCRVGIWVIFVLVHS
jgi:hypothetical protein